MATMNFTEWAKPNVIAAHISSKYDVFQSYREENRSKWEEIESYLFATDTTTLLGGNKFDHTTHIPMVAQLKEELEAIMYAAVLPHEDFLAWKPYSADAQKLSVRKAVMSYIRNRHSMNGFEKVFRKLIQDLVIYGNCFAQVVYSDDRDSSGIGYVGPKPKRISPYDIVFDATVTDFTKAPKLIRSMMSMGEFIKWASSLEGVDESVIEKVKYRRTAFSGLNKTEYNKNNQFVPDGFSDLQSYYTSGKVEVLRYYGDVYDEKTGEVYPSRYAVVIDRCDLLLDVEEPNSFIFKGSWSEKPDNTWSQGPLDKIVGINFQINHRENSKSDALDRFIYPDRVFMGDVEAVYNSETGTTDYLAPEGGGVRDLVPDTTVLTADMHQDRLMNHARLAAGLPPQIMGFRTPGEKTLGEVERLDDAALRKFLHKAAQFELDLLEPVVTAELRLGHDYFNEVIRSIERDEDGEYSMVEVTKEDLASNGVLVPIGARRFARQNQQMSALQLLGNSNLGQLIGKHLNTYGLAKAVEDLGGFSKFDFIDRNAIIKEEFEMQREQQIQEQLMVEELSNEPLE